MSIQNDIPIVDSHLHLWDPNHLPASWLDDVPLINKPFRTEEFAEMTKGLNIESIVYLQTEVNTPYSLLEAQWVVNECAKKDPRIKAVVPWAPLEDGEKSRAFIEALLRIGEGNGLFGELPIKKGKTFWSSERKGGHQLIKGIRRIIEFEKDIDFCIKEGFVKGVQLLAEYGLSCDINVKPQQLPNVIKLVSQCPNVQFVLDHFGKPKVKHDFPVWSELITQLAGYINVNVKLSGIVTEAFFANGKDWIVDDLQPYVDHILKVFGEDRVMFGSDCPVVLIGERVDYKGWLEIAFTLTKNLSHEAKLKIFNLNAKRFYRI